jgi:hypothetical protein
MSTPIRRRRKKGLPAATPGVTNGGNFNKKAKQLIDAAKAAVSTMENRMFADMYVYAVQQQIKGNPEFLRFIKQLKQPPVSIEEFLDSHQFMGSTDLKLWPEVRKSIIAMNSNWWKGWDVAYGEALLCGATGTGKSIICIVTTLYHMHILGCMKKPQRYWNLSDAISIVIAIQAAKPKVVKKVIYSPLRTYVETMPWFIKYMRPNKLIEAEMYFDEQNIRVIQGGTDADAVLGDALIHSVVDEINFMNVVQKSRRAEVGTGRAGTYDQAQVVYDTVSRRKKGRFTSRGPNVGVICLSSSTRYVGDFTDRRKQQVINGEIKTTYIYDKAQYEVVPQDRFCGQKFRLLVSTNAAQDIRILADDEVVPDGTVLEIPIEYKEDFERDGPGSLRDIVGKSANAINPFFRQQHKIIEAIRLGQLAGIESFLNKDNVVLAFDQGLPIPIRGHFCSNPSKPRYVHVDLAVTGDRVGIAMLRFDGLQWMARQTGETEPLPIVTIEMAVSVEPDHSNEIDISEIRAWVASLRSVYGYPIKAVTYDGWSSLESIQAWKRAGMKTGTVSVDRSPAPYKQLREAFNDGRIMMYHQPILVEELFGLEFDETKGKEGKVDHPLHGGKDVADAVCGAYHTLLNRSESWQMVGESDRPDGGERHETERR